MVKIFELSSSCVRKALHTLLLPSLWDAPPYHFHLKIEQLGTVFRLAFEHFSTLPLSRRIFAYTNTFGYIDIALGDRQSSKSRISSLKREASRKSVNKFSRYFLQQWLFKFEPFGNGFLFNNCILFRLPTLSQCIGSNNYQLFGHRFVCYLSICRVFRSRVVFIYYIDIHFFICILNPAHGIRNFNLC